MIDINSPLFNEDMKLLCSLMDDLHSRLSIKSDDYYDTCLADDIDETFVTLLDIINQYRNESQTENNTDKHEEFIHAQNYSIEMIEDRLTKINFWLNIKMFIFVLVVFGLEILQTYPLLNH